MQDFRLVKISELDPLLNVRDNDLVVISNGANSYKLTFSLFKEAVLSGVNLTGGVVSVDTQDLTSGGIVVGTRVEMRDQDGVLLAMFDVLNGALTAEQMAQLAQIAVNTGSITDNTTRITGLRDEIDANTSTIDRVIDTIESGAATNAAAIATNAIAIGANVRDISANAGAISANGRGISANVVRIASLRSDVAGMVARNFVNNPIQTNELGGNVVSTEKVGDLAITEGKIGNNAITQNKIRDLSITGDKIAVGTITRSKLAFTIPTSGDGTGGGGTGLTEKQEAFLAEVAKEADGDFALSAKVLVNPSNVANASFELLEQGPDFADKDGPKGRFSSITQDLVIRRSISFFSLFPPKKLIPSGFDFSSGYVRLKVGIQRNQYSGSSAIFTAIRLVLIREGSDDRIATVGTLSPTEGINDLNFPINEAFYTQLLAGGYNFRVDIFYTDSGTLYNGTFSVLSATYHEHSPLLMPVQAIATEEANKALLHAQGLVSALGMLVQNNETLLNSFIPRISPYRQIFNRKAQTDAYYSATPITPSTDVSTLFSVNSESGVFPKNTETLFVAVPANARQHLLTSTDGRVGVILGSTNLVSVQGSLHINGRNYFVYRLSGFGAAALSFQIYDLTPAQVVAWQADIDYLKTQLAEVVAKLANGYDAIPSSILDWLGKIRSDENSTTRIVATDFNKSFVVSGTAFIGHSNIIALPSSVTTIPRLVIFTTPQRVELTYLGATLNSIVNYNATTRQFLVTKLIPEVPANTSAQTKYPAPQSKIAGANIWQTILELHRNANNEPVFEGGELFFVADVPKVATQLTIRYRFTVLGATRDAVTITLNGVGGNSDVSTEFFEDTGAENIRVNVRWDASRRQIIISTELVSLRGIPTINNLQVILSFEKIIRTEAIDAHTILTPLITDSNGVEVIGLKQENDNLVYISKETEIDSGIAVRDFFGSTPTSPTRAGLNIYQYASALTLTTSVLTTLDTQKRLDYNGLFHEVIFNSTIVNIPSRLMVRDSAGNAFEVKKAPEDMIIIPYTEGGVSAPRRIADVDFDEYKELWGQTGRAVAPHRPDSFMLPLSLIKNGGTASENHQASSESITVVREVNDIVISGNALIHSLVLRG